MRRALSTVVVWLFARVAERLHAYDWEDGGDVRPVGR